jgi:cytoskeletal protein RodZ
MLPALSGCSLWNRVFHRHRTAGCTEKPFNLNTESRPLVKVPEGMSAPDTRNAIRISDLSDHPERARAPSEPCLAQPPNYFSTPLKLNLPRTPPKPKHWWTFWRRTPAPDAPTTWTDMAPAAPAPASPAAPAPAAPAAPAPASTTPAPATSDSSPK